MQDSPNNQVLADSKAKLSLLTPAFTQNLLLLISQFPNCFSVKSPKVLKKGIHNDIKATTNMSSKAIYEFLRCYCSTPDYVKIHIAGSKRYDLDGNEVGEVTQEEVDNTIALKRKITKVKVAKIKALKKAAEAKAEPKPEVKAPKIIIPRKVEVVVKKTRSKLGLNFNNIKA